MCVWLLMIHTKAPKGLRMRRDPIGLNFYSSDLFVCSSFQHQFQAWLDPTMHLRTCGTLGLGGMDAGGIG